VVARLEKQGFYDDCQHGFVKGRSTLTNLLETLEAWTRIIEEGLGLDVIYLDYRLGLDVIYLDYRKAFDTVPHRRLPQKLRKLGINDTLLIWIEHFLMGRHMRVQVNGSFSGWIDVLSGVPQGSVLGPLLFLIFVHDLPEWVKNSMMMFADDTKIWARIQKLEDKDSLQYDVDKLVEWSKQWLLAFNPENAK